MQEICLLPLIFNVAVFFFRFLFEFVLKCYVIIGEYMVSPVSGIDVPQPRFSWQVMHLQRNQSQTAFQVLFCILFYKFCNNCIVSWSVCLLFFMLAKYWHASGVYRRTFACLYIHPYILCFYFYFELLFNCALFLFSLSVRFAFLLTRRCPARMYGTAARYQNHIYIHTNTDARTHTHTTRTRAQNMHTHACIQYMWIAAVARARIRARTTSASTQVVHKTKQKKPNKKHRSCTTLVLLSVYKCWFVL